MLTQRIWLVVGDRTGKEGEKQGSEEQRNGEQRTGYFSGFRVQFSSSTTPTEYIKQNTRPKPDQRLQARAPIRARGP